MTLIIPFAFDFFRSLCKIGQKYSIEMCYIYILSDYISIICSHISMLFLDKTIENTVKWNDMKDFRCHPFSSNERALDIRLNGPLRL